MQFPSFTFLLSGFFIAYISYSIYTVSLLFTPPPCTNQKYCLSSYLSDQPKLQLNLYTSSMSRPLKKEITKIYTDANFDYTKESNM